MDGAIERGAGPFPKAALDRGADGCAPLPKAAVGTFCGALDGAHSAVTPTRVVGVFISELFVMGANA